MYDVSFYVAYPYYFPHFLPISKELVKQGFSVKFILSNKQNNLLMEQIANEEELDYTFGDDALFMIKSKVIFFANFFAKVTQLDAKTVFLCHGTGTKQCGFDSAILHNDLVILEGDYRYNKFISQYPEYKYKLKKVGYSKLDPIINISEKQKEQLQEKYSLDKNKKTILYAPTFFPSSIDKMSSSFPNDFLDFNIIVKPHYLSLERTRYKSHQKKFKKWESFQNCQIMPVEEYNLVPFLSMADIMISDESAAIFEFASLNKPVIINRFLKLRWSYYFNPKKLIKRMDKSIDEYRKIGKNVDSYDEMVTSVQEELNDSSLFEDFRLSKAKDICGNIDGKVSSRIVDLIRKDIE
jgi:CDP-glycerol glycerophosphotransferase (TagB/SpsB family)